MPRITNTNLAGFSLVELMVVVALTGILLAFAFPAYRDLTRNNCLTATANELITSLHLARSEAVKLRSIVQIFPAGGAWATGWEVRQGNDVLRQQDTKCNLQLVSASVSVNFSPRGGSGNGQHTFMLCDDRTGETGRTITVALTGRPEVTRTTCS